MATTTPLFYGAFFSRNYLEFLHGRPMPGPTPLSSAERATLSGAPFIIEEMESFMLRVQRKSPANTTTTIQLVRSLDGAGLTHGHAIGRFYAGGVGVRSPLKLDQDLGELRAKGLKWLPIKKDPSNGWGVSHVVNRLMDFQRYKYEQLSTAQAVSDEEVEVVKERSREQRDAVARAAAVDLVSDEDDEAQTPSRLTDIAEQPTPKRQRSGNAHSSASIADAGECVLAVACASYAVTHNNGVLRVYVKK